MFGQCLFECPYPKGVAPDASDPIVGDCFIAEHVHDFAGHYLHLCNRYTRVWSVCKFPTLYAAKSNEFEFLFKLLGFFRPSTMLVLIRNEDVELLQRYSLEFWQLSDDAESVRIVHTISVSHESLPLDHAQVYADGDTMRVFLSRRIRQDPYATWTPVQCILLECTTSSSQAVEKFFFYESEMRSECFEGFDFEAEQLVLHDDSVYRACSTGIEHAWQLREYDSNNINNGDGELLVHTTYSPLRPIGTSDPLLCTDGANIYLLCVAYGSECRLNAAKYDPRTQLWAMISTTNMSFDCTFKLHSAPAGEVLCHVRTWDDEREVRLLSTIAPKLSVLALRCVQKNMPEETAEQVALARHVFDPVSFVEFLLC